MHGLHGYLQKVSLNNNYHVQKSDKSLPIISTAGFKKTLYITKNVSCEELLDKSETQKLKHLTWLIISCLLY